MPPPRALGMVATAGYVIGEVGAEGPSGTWEDLVRARIFRPLGMSRTCANYSECAHKENRATPMTFDHHENKSDDHARTHTGARVWGFSMCSNDPPLSPFPFSHLFVSAALSLPLFLFLFSPSLRIFFLDGSTFRTSST